MYDPPQTRYRDIHTSVVASRLASAASPQTRKNSHGCLVERSLLRSAGVDIEDLIFILGPLLGAAAGYLADGAGGAMSGIMVPIGPLILAWLFGGH